MIPIRRTHDGDAVARHDVVAPPEPGKQDRAHEEITMSTRRRAMIAATTIVAGAALATGTGGTASADIPLPSNCLWTDHATHMASGIAGLCYTPGFGWEWFDSYGNYGPFVW
jgi:hypothetical protein